MNRDRKRPSRYRAYTINSFLKIPTKNTHTHTHIHFLPEERLEFLTAFHCEEVFWGVLSWINEVPFLAKGRFLERERELRERAATFDCKKEASDMGLARDAIRRLTDYCVCCVKPEILF